MPFQQHNIPSFKEGKIRGNKLLNTKDGGRKWQQKQDMPGKS
jgi:hypothetical protein